MKITKEMEIAAKVDDVKYLLIYDVAYTKNGVTTIMRKYKLYGNLHDARHYGIFYNKFGIPDRELIHFEIQVVSEDFVWKPGLPTSPDFKEDNLFSK